MKAPYLCFVLILIAGGLRSQHLRGRVTDSNTGKPLPGASVYINNTSTGTTTNEKGEFAIGQFPGNHFLLVASYVGYSTFSKEISTADTTFLNIPLAPAGQLEEVIVVGPEKNGWERWGFQFTRSFLGNSSIADECEIKNPGDLRFRYDKNTYVMTAHSIKPLIITNKYLGYRITYDLIGLTVGMRSGYASVLGYALFADLPGNQSRQRRWKQHRQEAYYGSLMQFMRAVYYDRIDSEGFHVRSFVRKFNKDKQRVRSLLDLHNGYLGNIYPPDSVQRFQAILRQPDFTDLLSTTPVRRKDIVASPESGNLTLYFKDYLLVTYPGKKESSDYVMRNKDTMADSCITGALTLETNTPLYLSASGNFSPADNLTISSYWAWSEKISTILPLDYHPDNKETPR